MDTPKPTALPLTHPNSTTAVAGETPRVRQPPKRFIKNQIPDSILNNASLNAAISLLPSNYSFEIHKSIWRVTSTNSKRVALQFPEGLLMYSLVISDILTAFANVERVFILGDVTYGACCVDDLSAEALGADLLIHYGHSCLVPVDNTLSTAVFSTSASAKARASKRQTRRQLLRSRLGQSQPLEKEIHLAKRMGIPCRLMF